MSAVSLTPRRDALAGVLAPLIGRMAPTGAFALPRDVAESARVLVVDSGDLTDLLFFAPVIHHLKYRFPGMRISVLVREGNSELIRTMEPISEMVSYEPEHLSPTSTTYFSLARRLRARRFDVVFVLGREAGLARTALAMATRARVRVGWAQRYGWPFLNCEIRRRDDGGYEAPRATSFLTALGLSPGDALRGWRLPDADVRWAAQMVHFRKPERDVRLIAVDPGVGKGRHRLVDRSLAAVVDHVASRIPSRVLVLSNNLDARGLARFRGLLRAEALDIEPGNVKEALALLSRSDLVLAGNTDFFHFAVSMRRPTVGFFTTYDTPNWYPSGTPWVQIVQGETGRRLSLDEVFSKVETLLSGAAP